MTNHQTNISLKIHCEGEIYHIQTYSNEYRSLMMLIYDKISPEDFGDCLGMGKCGTCLVEIEPEFVSNSYQRNEETTLQKAGAGDRSRLACQILIDEHINGLAVKILRP